MAEPSAMYLAVQELAQRTTMVRALASVAISRSPHAPPQHSRTGGAPAPRAWNGSAQQ